MTIKRGLRPLAGTRLLTEDERATLRDVSITTVEELVGAIRADSAGLSALLDRTTEELASLLRQARRLLGAEAKRELDQAPVDNYPLGARDPTER